MSVAATIPVVPFPIGLSGSTACGMGQIPFDVVVFDLDGTLVDSVLDLAAALNVALSHLGRDPIPVDQVRRMVGHGVRTLLEKALRATGDVNEALIEEGLPVLLRHYEGHIADHTRPYPGADSALSALAASGAMLAICTNKPEGLTRTLIDALGWKDRFAAIVGGDTLAQRKPDPAPVHEAIRRAGGGRAVFVGDSIVDTDAARAAGIPSIAVTFGFSERPADQLGATALIDHWDALLPTLRECR